MIRPLGNRILIDPIRNSDTSGGGIYVGKPRTSFARQGATNEQVCQGTILAVGPGKRNKQGRVIPVAAQPGQVVMFSDSCGREVEMDGRKLIFIREDDIAGFMEQPADTVEVMVNA